MINILSPSYYETIRETSTISLSISYKLVGTQWFRSLYSLSHRGSNILNSELFNIFYILKTLSLSIKSENVNELLHQGNNSRSINNYPGVHILSNYMCNKSFHNWRPQGQIITTLYDHDKNQVEKLLPLPENKFVGFISLWHMPTYSK